MKIELILCATMALPQFAQAEAPFSSQAFGMVQGTVDYCVRIKPDAAARYQAVVKLMTQDIPEEEVAKIRDTDEYKQAYDSVSTNLDEVPVQQAMKSCTAFLETDARS